MDIHDYFDGTRTPDQLSSFIDQLPRTSRLTAARANDVEMYRAAVDRNGKPPGGKPDPPPLYEWSREHEALGAIFYQLQQVAHLIANQNAKNPKKFKGQRWPFPVTAADILRKQRAREAFEEIEGQLKFVSVEEWQAQHGEKG